MFLRNRYFIFTRIITEIIGTASFPREDGQANFGYAGMPYWHVADKIVVAYEKYYLFKQSWYQENNYER